MKKAGSSFSEEKEAKRLLLIWAGGAQHSRLNRQKSFLQSFFSKKATA